MSVEQVIGLLLWTMSLPWLVLELTHFVALIVSSIIVYRYARMLHYCWNWNEIHFNKIIKIHVIKIRDMLQFLRDFLDLWHKERKNKTNLHSTHGIHTPRGNCQFGDSHTNIRLTW